MLRFHEEKKTPGSFIDLLRHKEIGSTRNKKIRHGETIQSAVNPFFFLRKYGIVYLTEKCKVIKR